MALNIPKGLPQPKILVEHDVSLKPFQRFQSMGQNITTRLLGHLQGSLWKRCEPAICNAFDAVVTLTKDDQSILIKNGVTSSIRVIPPPVSIDPNQLRDILKERSICFVGSFNRRPNIEALNTLINDIWPIIKTHIPGCQLKIAGKYLSGPLLKVIKKDPSLFYYGFISDIDRFIAKSSLFIAPITLGGGLKMKITHALACGTPVITTQIGAEGIGIAKDEGLFVVNDLREIARIAIQLLQDKERISILSYVAAHATQKLFNISNASSAYNQLYNDLIKRK